MCGRYSVLTEDEIIEVRKIIQEVSLSFVKDSMANYTPPKGEIRPTDGAPVITKNNDGLWFESARFGFKKWDGKGVIINARSETVADKGMFAKTGRCVVPASEYYEWRDKKKHFIKDGGGNLLFFAGLYRDGEDGREFVIITKEASGAAAEVHDRMPVVLHVGQLEGWLNGGITAEELAGMDFNDTVAAKCDEGCEQLSLFD